ncbi:hypothetical protein ACHAXT_004542 [Thalassiosira profunda]
MASMLATAAARPSLFHAAIRRAWRPSVQLPACTDRPDRLFSSPPEPIRLRRPLGRNKGHRSMPKPPAPKPKSKPTNNPAKIEIDYKPLPPPIREGSKKKWAKARKKKSPQLPDRYKGDIIHQQSKHSTRDLFDAIFPHVEIKTLHKVNQYIIGRRIGKIPLQKMDKGERWRALSERLDAAFDSSGQEAEDFHYSVKRHPWMQRLIEDYFMGLPPKRPNREDIGGKHGSSDWKRLHVATLVKARETATKHPTFWTKALLKEAGYNVNGAGTRGKGKDKLRAAHCAGIKELHSQKNEEELQSDAEGVLETLLEKLPHAHFEKLMEKLVKSSDKDGRIPILGNALGAVSPSHAHFVAVDLARYLYVDLPNSADEEGEAVISPADVLTRKSAVAAIEAHGKLRTAQRRYKRERSRFLDKARERQNKFALIEKKEKTTLRITLNAGKDAEGVSDDLEGTPLENWRWKEDEKEDVEETLEGLQTRGAQIGAGKGRGGGRPRERVHLNFTAIKLDSDAEPEASQSESAERLVFLDNLPIDTTQDEIDQVYSRCGPLDSIQLFNLRPDLDPGPLSKKQLEERRRKTRLNNRGTFGNFGEAAGRQERPRTPVYGMLRFQTAEGYKVATCPDLTIFGINIRRHPVLSIKPEQRTTLFIEQIPNGLYEHQLENDLAAFFRTHNFGVMLDGSGYRKMKDKAGSCQLKFEDFHSAHLAYDLLRSESADKEDNKVLLLSSESIFNDYDEVEEEEKEEEEEEEEEEEVEEKEKEDGSKQEECKVHWFRTPEKSLQWWTRELGPL